MVCWKVWVWGGGSTEGGGSEVLLRARVLCCAGVRPGMRSWCGCEAGYEVLVRV